MAGNNRIRRLCIVLVATVLVLSLLLMVGMCTRVADGGMEEETTRQSWADYLLGNLQAPGDLGFETFDWGDDPIPDGDILEDAVGDLVGMNGGLMPSGEGLDDNTVILNLYGQIPDRVYLKMQSFGDYNGQGFEPAEAYMPIEGGISADFLPAYLMREGSDGEAYWLEIDPVLNVAVLPYYADARNGEDTPSDVCVEGNESTPHLTQYRHWTAVERKKLSSWLRDYEKQYGWFVHDQYLSLDIKTADHMRALVKREGFDPNDPDIIQKVADYISHAATYNLNYDPALDQEHNVAIAFLEDYKEGVCRHYAAAATLLYRYLGIPARYTVGFAADIDAETVTPVTAAQAHAWVEVYIGGIGWQYVEVTGGMSGIGGGGGGEGGGGDGELPLRVVLSPSYVGKYYDGTPLHHNHTIDGFERFIREGYSYEATVSYEPVILGKSPTAIESVTLYDPHGNDVTADFQIEFRTGYIQAYYDEFTFMGVSKSRVYDGSPLMMTAEPGTKGDPYADVSLNKGIIPEDIAWEMIPTGMQNGVGQSDATFIIRLTGQTPEGEYGDVTDYYRIEYIYGTLEVTPAYLTLEAVSAEKRYDGEPLSAPAYFMTQGELMPGHFLAECAVEGERTMIGRSSNVITHVVICNEFGEDVTANYSIQTIDGVLRVRP